MGNDVIRCNDCDRDITEEVQVYDKGEVCCEDCNIKKDTD